eukprot:jgi/Ulvmu1/1066/UM105_0025.1
MQSSVRGRWAYAVFFTGGFVWSHWHAIVPFVHLLTGAAFLSGIYLRGPSFVASVWPKVIGGFSTPCFLFIRVSSTAGPQSYVPFDDRVITTCTAGMAVGTLGLALTSVICGSVATGADAGKERLHMALTQAALMTLKFEWPQTGALFV